MARLTSVIALAILAALAGPVLAGSVSYSGYGRGNGIFRTTEREIFFDGIVRVTVTCVLPTVYEDWLNDAAVPL